MKKNRIEWVCHDCAYERGARFPEGHVATFHEDICDLCGEIKTVTQPRDYGKTRNLIEGK